MRRGDKPLLWLAKLGTAESVRFYNRRQDIEAGIKEFHMRFFSPEAIRIQEQLITFLPNFIRWVIRYHSQSHPHSQAR